MYSLITVHVAEVYNLKFLQLDGLREVMSSNPKEAKRHLDPETAGALDELHTLMKGLQAQDQTAVNGLRENVTR